MAKAQVFLHYQTRVADWLRETNTSFRALARLAESDHSTIADIARKPGYNISRDLMRRLIPIVPGLDEAYARDAGIAATTASTGDFLPPRDTTGIIMLRPNQIVPWDRNPRKSFDAESIEGLGRSISERGVLQNLTVRLAPGAAQIIYPSGEPMYQLGAGERRWRAACWLVSQGMKPEDEAFLPCRIVQASDEEFIAIAVMENAQREDVPAIEEAEGFAAWQAMNPKLLTAEFLAEKLGKSAGYIGQRLLIAASLVDEGKQAMRDGTLSFDKARELRKIGPEAQRNVIARMQAGDRRLHGTTELFKQEIDFHAVMVKPAKASKSEAEKPADDLPPPPDGVSRDDPPPAELRKLALPSRGWTFSPAKGRRITITAEDEETKARILTLLEKSFGDNYQDAA